MMRHPWSQVCGWGGQNKKAGMDPRCSKAFTSKKLTRLDSVIANKCWTGSPMDLWRWRCLRLQLRVVKEMRLGRRTPMGVWRAWEPRLHCAEGHETGHIAQCVSDTDM